MRQTDIRRPTAALPRRLCAFVLALVATIAIAEKAADPLTVEASRMARIGGAFGGALRYGLANMKRRAGGSLVQIMALGIGIMAMVMLTLVRSNLIATWQRSIHAGR